MKRQIIIKAEVETDDDFDLIKKDLMSELRCCWHDFSFIIMEVKNETDELVEVMTNEHQT